MSRRANFWRVQLVQRDQEMTPVEDATQLQLIVSLVTSGQLETAAKAAEMVLDKTLACEAWRQISRAYANTQRWDEAQSTLEIALQHRPDLTELRLERAIVLAQRGRADEALVELTALAREFPESPQLLVHWCRALQFADRADEAEAHVEAALRRWPIDVPLHVLLAELRWNRGADEEATRALESAIDAHPGEPQLRLVAADLLRNAGNPQRALTLLEGGLRAVPESAPFLTSIGVLLDALDRSNEALPFLRAALTRAPNSLVGAAQSDSDTVARRRSRRGACFMRCAHDARAGRSATDRVSRDCAATARSRRISPALRLRAPGARLPAASAGRPPERYRAFQCRIRAGIAGDAPGGAAATRAESARRNADRAQSARGQCAGRAVLRDDRRADPGLHREAARERSIIPTDRRASTGYRVSGSWSVQLQPGGYHIDHVHPRGWLSSAYYVELPETAATDDRAGGMDQIR